MRFYVIGIDDNKEQSFNSEINQIIASHRVFSGGVRHHKLVKSLLPDEYEWIDIVTPLENVFSQYKNYSSVVVFASGDPLFYGFANTIQRMMHNAEIILFPHFNSLQTLAHRILMPYHDMHIVSLTGRNWLKFDEALITGYEKIGILTDSSTHTPSTIAARMLEYGYDNYTMTVGELLGNREKERISEHVLTDVAQKEFSFPNNIILKRTHIRPRPFGIPESEFHLLDGRTKMITKMPIRLLSLSMLDLRNKTVLWDIGFCTGSVSIEAKLQFPHLQIVAFEKRTEGEQLMELNSHRFGTPGIRTITGDFSESYISIIPKPDAVFIGGHGGKLNEIISIVKKVLNDNGTIVFNSVTEESRKLFVEALADNDLQLESSIAVTIDNFNTVEVMKAIKHNQI